MYLKVLDLEVYKTGNDFQLTDGWTVAKRLRAGSTEGLSAHHWTCLQYKYKSPSTFSSSPASLARFPRQLKSIHNCFLVNETPQAPKLQLPCMPRTVWNLVNLHSSTPISVLNPTWIHKLGNSSPIFPGGISLVRTHLTPIYRTRHCTKYHSRNREFNKKKKKKCLEEVWQKNQSSNSVREGDPEWTQICHLVVSRAGWTWGRTE